MADEVTEKQLAELYESRRKDTIQARTRRMRRAEGLPEALSSVLNTYFKSDQGALLKIDEQRALFSWAEYVGNSAARFSQALRVRNGTLTVLVSDPLWMQQLSLIKQEILKRYKKEFPRLGIRSIFFARQP